MKSTTLPLFLALTMLFGISVYRDFQPAAQGASVEVADKARGIWLTAFMKMKEADEALAADNQALALKLYTEASESYKTLLKEHPGWRTEMVEYRLNYTVERSRALETRLKAAQEKLPPAELATLVTTLKEQIVTLRERSARAEEELQKSKAEIEKLSDAQKFERNLERSIARLEEERNDLKAKLDVADSNKVILRETIDARNTLAKALEKQKQDNAQLEEQVSKLDNTIGQLKADNRRLAILATEATQVHDDGEVRLESQEPKQNEEIEIVRKERNAFKRQFEFHKKLNEDREETIQELREKIAELEADN